MVLRLAAHSMLVETLPLHSVRQRLRLAIVVVVSISSVGRSPELEMSPQPATEQTVPGFRSTCGEGRWASFTYSFSVADVFSWAGSQGRRWLPCWGRAPQPLLPGDPDPPAPHHTPAPTLPSLFRG